MRTRSRQHSARPLRRSALFAPVSPLPPTLRRRSRFNLHDARRISLCALAMGSCLCAGALLAGPALAIPVAGSDENGPLVSIIQPGYNDVLKGKYRILIGVTAQKYNPQSVEMFIDDVSATGGPKPLSSLASSSYDFDTRAYSDGKHKLTVRVTDAQGFRGWSEVTIFVNNGQIVDTVPPDLRWVGIAPFQQVNGSVKLEIDAADDFGVKLLQIQINPIETPNRTPALYSWLLNHPPYSVELDTVGRKMPDGLYTLKALAFDSNDQQGEAPPLTIGLVNNAVSATTVEEMLRGRREMADIVAKAKGESALKTPASKPKLPATKPSFVAPDAPSSSASATLRPVAPSAEPRSVPSASATPPAQQNSLPSAPAIAPPRLGAPSTGLPQTIERPATEPLLGGTPAKTTEKVAEVAPQVSANSQTRPFNQTPTSPSPDLQVPGEFSPNQLPGAETEVEAPNAPTTSATPATPASESPVAETPTVESSAATTPTVESSATESPVETPDAQAPTATETPANETSVEVPSAIEVPATEPSTVAPSAIEVPATEATGVSATEVPAATAAPAASKVPTSKAPTLSAPTRVAELPRRPLSERVAGEPGLSRFGSLDARIASTSSAKAAPQSAPVLNVARLSLPGLVSRRVGGAPVLSQIERADESRVSRIEAPKRVRLAAGATLTASPLASSPALSGVARAVRAPSLIERALGQPSKLVRQAQTKTSAPRVGKTNASKAVAVKGRALPLEIAPSLSSAAPIANSAAAQSAPRMSAPTTPRIGGSVEAPSRFSKAVPREGKAPRIAALPRPDAATSGKRIPAITIVPVDQPLQVAAVEVPASYTIERTTTLRSVAARFGLPVELVALSNDWPAEMKLLKGVTVRLPRPLQVSYNGVPMAGDAPSMVLGKTGVTAFRFLFEQSGGKLQWNAKNQRVVARKGDQEIVLNIGSKIARVGDKDVAMELAAFLFEGRTMVPIRFFEESLNAQVDWNPQTGRLVVAMAG